MGRGWQLSIFCHFRSQGKGNVTQSRCSATKTRRGVGRNTEHFWLHRGFVDRSYDLLDTPLPSIFCQISSSFHSSCFNHSQPSDSSPSNSLASKKSKSSPDFSHLPGARKPKTSLHGSGRVLEITSQQAGDAFAHCLNLVRQHDIDNYLAALLMPKKMQPEIIALLALNVELALVRDKVEANNKGTTGIYRLQFWKDALDAIYGAQTALIPRQPIAVALCSFAPSASLKLAQTLVQARQESIGDRQFETVQQASKYSSQTWGTLIRLQVGALSRPDNLYITDSVGKAADQLGAAFGIANLIRSALPFLSRGILLLPLDLFTIHNLSPDKVYNRKQREEAKAMVKDLVQVSSSHLVAARSYRNEVPSQVRMAFLSQAASTDHILSVCRKVDYDLFSPSLQRRAPWQAWTLWGRKIMSRY